MVILRPPVMCRDRVPGRVPTVGCGDVPRLATVAGDEEQLYVMRPLEIAACVATGHDGTLAPSASGERDPRRVLELVVLQALQRPPCGVAFSGGRDSSAVLRVAVHVARREELPVPIPITKVFPDVPTTEEQRWQDRVIDHLRLADWQRIVIHDELDLLGPFATASLVDHGVVWPPTIHGDRPVVDRVGGGSLIDGEGGDEVLGVTAHRIAPMTTLVRSPRSVTPARLHRAAVALLPKQLRARRVRIVGRRTHSRGCAPSRPLRSPPPSAGKRPSRLCRSPRA